MILLVSLTVYLAAAAALVMARPSAFFDARGRLRPFGVSRGASVLSLHVSYPFLALVAAAVGAVACCAASD